MNKSRLFEQIYLQNLREDTPQAYFNHVLTQAFSMGVKQHQDPQNFGIGLNTKRLNINDKILAKDGQEIDGNTFVAEVDKIIQQNLPRKDWTVAHDLVTDYVRRRLAQN